MPPHHGYHGQENGTLAPPRSNQVAHTLTACCRCRQRKTRCDASLPRCGPCERNNAQCEYFDAAKGKKMPRSYVIYLQDRVRELERELATFPDPRDSDVDTEKLVRGAGLVRIQDNEEPSYLGPASGINMTRLVMELAKGIRKIRKIKDLIPEEQARRIREHFEAEARKPNSKEYPEFSSIAAPDLPSLELTNLLVENFFKKEQYLYPLLHEPSFRQLALNVYNGSMNPYENFALRMVVALGMQTLDSQWAGLADSYYLAALKYLEAIAKLRSLETVQCFMLIAQYSMITPTRTAANWVVLLAVRLCQDLGITEESTIGVDSSGNPLDPLEVDMRRRCYWVCFWMEHGLAHSMGRPNAFGASFAHMNVKWFQMVDDQDITRQGINTSAPHSPKKLIARHFMNMRLMQLEIRRTLYLKRRPTPLDDSDPWFQDMDRRLDDWLASIPPNDGPAYDRDWFTTQLNTVIVFLFRPSPQVPEPSAYAARKCFVAVKANIERQCKVFESKKVEITWVFCQQLFMAINTVLWAISYSDVRRDFPREEVLSLINKALETIYFCALKWPGVEGACELYGTLSHTCLKAYDGEEEKSYSLGSPINRPSPATTDSPEPVSSPLSLDFSQHTTIVSDPSSPEEKNFESSPPTMSVTPITFNNQIFESNHIDAGTVMDSAPAMRQEEPQFMHDPSAYTNPLPPMMHSNIGNLMPDNLYSPLYQPYTSMTYDSFNRAFAAPWASNQPAMALDLQQHSELMSQLETVRMTGIIG